MMISSLIVFPALSAMRIFRSFFKVIICAVIISLVCFIVGIISSFVWSTPAGASIIVANLIAFVICMVVGKCVR
jgi:zinc transport system permease protein